MHDGDHHVVHYGLRSARNIALIVITSFQLLRVVNTDQGRGLDGLVSLPLLQTLVYAISVEMDTNTSRTSLPPLPFLLYLVALEGVPDVDFDRKWTAYMPRRRYQKSDHKHLYNLDLVPKGPSLSSQ